MTTTTDTSANQSYRFVRPVLYPAGTRTADMQGYYLYGLSPKDALSRADATIQPFLVLDRSWHE